MAGCTTDVTTEQALDTQAPPPPPMEEVVPVTDVTPPEEAIPVQEETKMTQGADLVSNIACIGGDAIKLTLTNVEDNDLTIASDVQFLVNALMVDPDCDQLVLNPGQSTSCTLTSGNLGFTPSIIVTTPNNKDVRKVTC